jgi:hypothetical protein
MRVLIGVVLLGVGAYGSAHRLTAWRSDQALLTAAVQTTPHLPDAALRLGAVYAQRGQWKDAAEWTLRAAQLKGERPTPPRAFPGAVPFATSLSRQAWFIDTFYPVCHRPGWARVCA